MTTRTYTWMVVSILCTLTSARAVAQVAEPTAESPALPDVASEDSTRPACLVETLGVDGNEAVVAATMLCSKLQSEGIALRPLSFDVGTAQELYRIRIGKLGSVFVVELIHERPVSVPQRARTIHLSSLEDMIVASGRLVDALLHNRAVQDTANVTNLVNDETRQPNLIRSRLSFGFALSSYWSAGADAGMGYGAEFVMQQQMPRLALGVVARANGGQDVGLIGLGLGARYFFTESNVAPFVGAGAGLLHLSVTDEDQAGPVVPYGESEYGKYQGTGLALQVEAGVELMRFSRSRMGVALRVDVPLFTLEADLYSADTGAVTEDSMFVLPVGVQLYYLF